MKLHIYDDKRWKEIHDIKGSNGVKGGRCRHMVGMRLSIYGPHSLHKQTIFQGTRTEPRFRDSYMVLVSVKDIILLYVFTEDTLTNHYFPKKLRLILYIYITNSILGGFLIIGGIHKTHYCRVQTSSGIQNLTVSTIFRFWFDESEYVFNSINSVLDRLLSYIPPFTSPNGLVKMMELPPEAPFYISSYSTSITLLPIPQRWRKRRRTRSSLSLPLAMNYM